MGRRAARLASLVTVATLGVFTLPGVVAAELCPHRDPVRDFAVIAALPEPYVVVFGTLSVTGVQQEIDGFAIAPGRIVGRQLGRNGFMRRVALDFELRFACTALSCQVLGSGGEALVFLRREAAGLVLDSGYCSSNEHYGVDAATLRAVVACHVRGACGD
jgi:hypothetical protein